MKPTTREGQGIARRPPSSYVESAKRFSAAAALCAALMLALSLFTPAVAAAPPDCNEATDASCVGQWTTAGQNIANTRNQPNEGKIRATNVAALTPAWTFTTQPSVTSTVTGDVSATPTVAGNTVYFPDWGGHLYALNAKTGQLIWSRKISDYNGVPGTYSRVSPAVIGNLLILGDQPASGILGWGQGSGRGAHMMAVNARTGDLVWITQVDNHFASQITASAVVFDDVAYVGVSSVEEVTAIVPGYVCCTFRGSEVALDVRTGRIVWKTYTVPTGYSGGAIWGSTAAVDPARGSLYVATGNNYSVPDAVRQCEEAGGQNCGSPDNHFDSLMALNLATGAIKWATGTIQFDEWSVACFIGQAVNCPSPNSPDADFGSGPNLFTAGSRQLVGAGTKAGTYWALDPATGRIIWATQVGPGGIFGGIEWGSSVANARVFVAIANSSHVPVTFTHPAPGSATQTSGGFWAALDGVTGAILWQSADPAGPTFGDIGATSTANGVVYAGSMDSQGHVFGMDAATGEIKWRFATGGSVASGPSIVNGTVYWGSGYARFGAGNNRLFAFRLPG